MKKSLIFLFLLGIASALTAQTTIWTMDWLKAKAGPSEGVYNANTNFGVFQDSELAPNTPEMQAAGTDVWAVVGRTIGTDVGGTGKGGIWVEQQATGAPAPSRGISYVLDSSFFTTGAGDYTLNYEIWSIYTPTTLIVSIYETQASPGNDYFIDLASPGGEALMTMPAEGSSATVTLRRVANLKRDLAGGDIVNSTWNVRTLDFSYSGVGDVVLHIHGYVGDTGWTGFTIGGDMSITTEMGGGGQDPLWAGYAVRPDGYVDTTPFIGWIWVGDPLAPSDWIWSVSLNNYVYMPQNLVNPEAGAWAYVPRY